MTTNIYDQHRAAFSNVSAYVIMKDNERVATIAFKFPKDGALRLWCYFHYLGLPMVRAYAGGYGYDKRSAAARNAISINRLYTETGSTVANVAAMQDAMAKLGGNDWDRALRDAGFTVLQAV